MCLEAVKNNPRALKSVPIPLRTKEICAISLSNEDAGIHEVEAVLPAYMTDDFYNEAIDDCIYILKEMK